MASNAITRRETPELDEAIWAALPRPLLPRRPDLVACYRGAWAIAAAKAIRPPRGWNIAQDWYVDACFAEGIFQWDSCFITMWLKYAQGALPQITNVMSCLDNFYDAQDEDGAIPREILPSGKSAQVKFKEQDSAEMKPYFRHSAFTNPPLFSWAEWDYYEHTGDDSRLTRVIPMLAKYFDWYSNNRTRPNGTFWYDVWGSGMDNVPRGDAWGWVDYTAQAALDCEYLARIALLIDHPEIANAASTNYLLLKELVNDKMWNEMKLHYCDIDEDEFWTGTLNVGMYWPLMADIAPPMRVAEMVRHLRSVRTFGRLHMVPSLAAFEKGFSHRGDYWLGGVWAPTTYMVIRALERAGEGHLSHAIALNHVENVARVFMETGTIWENYAPDVVERGEKSKPDFCGWSALGPIAALIESVLGIRVYGDRNEVVWDLHLEESHGIENLRVRENHVSLFAEWWGGKWHVTISSTGPVDVIVRWYGEHSTRMNCDTPTVIVG